MFDSIDLPINTSRFQLHLPFLQFLTINQLQVGLDCAESKQLKDL